MYLEKFEIPAEINNWPVMICLLGGFRIFKAGQPINLRNASKTRSLLVLLALSNNRFVSRETLLQTLWPDIETNLASQSLSSLIHNLRAHLKDKMGGKPPIIHDDGNYQLNFEAGIGVDLYLFESLLSNGEKKERMGNLVEAIPFYQSAINLYEGDLCEIKNSQALMVAESLRAHYLTLLSRLADYHYEQDDLPKCLEFTNQLLAIDPCREDAHRLAMRVYLKQGNRSQALRQYQVCKKILQAEFDTIPETASTELFDQIRLTANIL